MGSKETMTNDWISAELELFRTASTVWELGKAYPMIGGHTAQATTALLDFIGALRREQAVIAAAHATTKNVPTITVDSRELRAPGEREISRLYELFAAERSLSDYIEHVLQPQFNLCAHDLWAVVGKITESVAAVARGDVECERHPNPETKAARVH